MSTAWIGAVSGASWIMEKRHFAHALGGPTRAVSDCESSRASDIA
jgi:hypothetical protein